MQCDNYSSHQAGHLRKYSKWTEEKIFACVTVHPHQPNKFNQCDSAYSRAESFEINSGENVHKLQELEDAKENQMLQKAIDHVCFLDELGILNELVNLRNWMY